MYSFNFFEPQFPHLWNVDDNNTIHLIDNIYSCNAYKQTTNKQLDSLRPSQVDKISPEHKKASSRSLELCPILVLLQYVTICSWNQSLPELWSWSSQVNIVKISTSHTCDDEIFIFYFSCEVNTQISNRQ